MKFGSQVLAAGAIVLASGAFMASAHATDDHTILTPEEVEWGEGPPSIPPGAEAVVLYGNPGDEEVFALRLKLPADYTISPHHHPRPEIVTVISGTANIGTGETVDRDAAMALPAGSFFAFEPGMPHYLFTEEETVIQLNSTGPWDLEYVDAEDDPRS